MGLYPEARQLARQAAPAVMERLIDLALHSADERVSSVCCVAVLDRAYGRPREMPEQDSLERRIANMTREERRARMAELLAPMIEAEEREAKVVEAEAASASTARDRSVTGS
jgi:hypothetical protein